MWRSLFVLILLGLIGAGAWLYSQDRAAGEVSYVTADVVEGRLRETVTATGSVNAVVTVEVGSQQSGQISELLVDFNDTVKKDQPVARLDQQSYEARRAEAHASLEMAKAAVEIKQAELERSLAELADAEANLAVLTARRDGAQAKFESADAELKRKQDLRAKGVAPIGELETAQTRQKIEEAALREAEAVLKAHEIKVSVARANVARQKADLANGRANIPQKEALLKLAEVELERTVIRSPIDGVVIKRNVSEGQTVAASLEAPTLFTIAQDLAEMELHARVDETDVGRVKIGQSARFTVDAFPGRVFEGSVAQIRKAPEVIQNVVTYTVVIKTRNDELLLLPGMTASIQILVMETDPVLKVPSAALAFQPSAVRVDPETNKTDASEQSQVVWVLTPDETLKPVQVRTGLRDRASVAVESGELKAGDKVVTNEIAAQADNSLFGLRIGF
jgi:HlyD family secretion protein